MLQWQRVGASCYAEDFWVHMTYIQDGIFLVYIVANIWTFI